MSQQLIGVVGAGAMGAGIAQLAASFGDPVFLFDVRADAAANATEGIRRQLDQRVAEGKLSSEVRGDVMSRLMPVSSLDHMKDCTLVIEAIVESLAPKRELFAKLETVVSTAAILATNTSSLSISAIAAGLKHRRRFVGMHFFNPVHAMKLVEVVAGVDTDPGVVEATAALAGAWGKTAVSARSTPGFIVNRIARPYYAEALIVIQEHAGDPQTIDALLRGAGFRMGPCELMDLIGHDVNFAVTESMFRTSYYDRRFTPSWVQQDLVDSGRLGRKTGRGFFSYPRQPDMAEVLDTTPPLPMPVVQSVVVRGNSAVAERLFILFQDSPVPTKRQWGGPVGLDFILDDKAIIPMAQTDGRTARELALGRLDGNQGVFDWYLGGEQQALLGVAFSDNVPQSARRRIVGACRSAGLPLVELADSPGLMVARTISMLINEAADAVQQRVCTEGDANLAMRLGVNYPAGPLDWLERFGSESVISLLRNLSDYYRGERYRVSPWLQQRRWRELGARG